MPIDKCFPLQIEKLCRARVFPVTPNLEGNWSFSPGSGGGGKFGFSRPAHHHQRGNTFSAFSPPRSQALLSFGSHINLKEMVIQAQRLLFHDELSVTSQNRYRVTAFCLSLIPRRPSSIRFITKSGPTSHSIVPKTFQPSGALIYH
jgi:hypothetical protein